MDDDEMTSSYAPLLAPLAKQIETLNSGVERDDLHFVRVCSEVDTDAKESSTYLSALEVSVVASARARDVLTARSFATTDARARNPLATV